MNKLLKIKDDFDSLITLFYIDKLNSTEIYEISKELNNKISDDILKKIIANGADNNENKKLLENYLDVLGINFLDFKKALTAKVFYYILQDKINFYNGISFLVREVIDRSKTIEYLGDDIGIDQIIGNFYYIDDGDASNEKYIETAIEDIFIDMKQYINDHSNIFPMDNNILMENEKIVINKEIEEKVKIKALAKGIEIKNHWEEASKLRRLTIEIFENIKKLDSKILPKNKKELADLIKTMINKSDNEIEKIIEEMFYINKIIEKNNKIKFNLE